MAVSWVIKTDNGSVYTSQQFIDFMGSWKNYSHCRYPLQFHDQAIVEHINHVIKEFLSQLISPEAKWDPNLVLLEVLFHISFLSFDKVGLSPAYKHQAYLPRDISLPLLRWKEPINFQWQFQFHFCFEGKGKLGRLIRYVAFIFKKIQVPPYADHYLGLILRTFTEMKAWDQ